MVYVNGTAHIRHAQSGQVYEIDADMLDFESVSSEERSMGPETAYSAVVEHPELAVKLDHRVLQAHRMVRLCLAWQDAAGVRAGPKFLSK